MWGTTIWTYKTKKPLQNEAAFFINTVKVLNYIA